MARLSPEILRRARDLIAVYPQPRSALIPILHLCQEQDGYLTEDAMAHVAELLDLTPAEVLGTASFYDMFFTHPVGTYLVSVCTNIACMLNGGQELLEHAETTLGVKAGGTTADGTFTLEEVECIALCGNAPCLTVNWRFRGDVTHDAFDRLVEDLRGNALADEIPPHGTLVRTRRSVGLVSGVPKEGRGGLPPRIPVASEAAPAPAPTAAPTPTPTATASGSPTPGPAQSQPAPERPEAQPASAAAAEAAPAQADATEEPTEADTAPAGDDSRPQKAGDV